VARSVVADPLAAIRSLSAGRIAVVFDDDATGTQTVRDVEVVMRPTNATLRARLETSGPGFFVLTNSRSLGREAARDLARRLGRHLRAETTRSGHAVSLISRSDSTLRGHFPAEVDALAEGFGLTRARILLAPFFGEGGRVTVDDVHYLRAGDALTPVSETEFARDGAFGYQSSNLRDWVAEKAPGRTVQSVSLADLRASSGDALRSALAETPPGGVCVVNALEQRDIELAALGALQAELDGVELVARTAASYVRARLGLSSGGLIDVPASVAGPGIVVIGSHVPTTTAQLERLLDAPPGPVELIEVPVDPLVDDPASAPRTASMAASRADAALRRGDVPVIASSRGPRRGRTAAEDLAIAAAVSEGLVRIVRRIRSRPGWVLAKGGITSSDIAVRGLGASSATVLGQLAPGIAAWRLDPGSRLPGLFYVVFPGNVGDRDSLRAACARLIGRKGAERPEARVAG
jgi:uncharacterized protein YgbK (DUF1537 family)